MSALRRKIILLAGAAFCSVTLHAQVASNAAASSPVKSPVAVFRELLAMSPEQRRAAIAVRPPEIRKRILEKLSEYEILPDDLREQRLRETELRWYLRPLMDEGPTNRAARLALVPQEQRQLVEERLQAWDILPPDLKEKWKNDDVVANYFAQIQSAPDQRAVILNNVPPSQRAELERELAHWQLMTDDERQKALFGWRQLFELPPAEQEKTLEAVSDADRQQMEKTLADYGKLTPIQRAQCVRSFEKFATMSLVERQQFLKNAERWKEMTPEEQQKWHDLVNMAPIIPPSANPTPRVLQSSSHRLIPSKPGAAVATN